MRYSFFRIMAILSVFFTLMNVYGGGSQSASSQTAVPDRLNNLNLSGFPIVKEPITLDMVVRKAPVHGPWTEMIVLNRYAERTNIKVNYEEIPQDGYQEKKNLMFASNQGLPDAFFAGELTRQDEIAYGIESGLIIRLNDLLDKYAPVFMKAIQNREDVKKSIYLYDGGLYSFPRVAGNYLETRTAGGNAYVNKKWLDQLKMDIPTTTDEFYLMLKAFKENFPNGIPLSGDLNFIKNAPILQGAFGITSNMQMFDIVDGKPRFVPMEDSYRELLQYLARLYNEGLLDPLAITQTGAQYNAQGQANTMGVITSSAFWAVAGNAWEDYVNIPPLTGPKGQKMWGNISPSVQAVGTYAITKNNKYPEASVRWVDYWYSSEGIREIWAGYENETYKFRPDGKWEFMDIIVNNPNGLNRNEALGRISPWQGANLPQIGTDEHHQFSNVLQVTTVQQGIHFESSIATARFAPKALMPTVLPYTADEQRRLTILETDIQAYVDQKRVEFIMGRDSFNNWDAYIRQLKMMNADQYIQLVQTAYAR